MIQDLRRAQHTQKYARPNQNWQCGHDCHDCSLGPNSRGQCQAVAECQPVADGDSWRCTRTALQGGACTGGPAADGVCGLANLQCQPRRSLRWWRGRLTLAMTALTLGGLIIVFSLPQRNNLIAPGPLSGSHAHLMSQQNRCSACHGAASGNLFSWSVDAISGGRQSPQSQSDLCMHCHGQTIDANYATNPHNLSLQQLARLTDKNSGNAGAFDVGFLSNLRDGSEAIACAACHREHHGTDHDLKKLADSQCQSCHSRQFTHFSQNHPDFTNWPPQSARTIHFDHAAHALKHFAANNKKFECSSCHHSDRFGNVQLVKPFVDSCAECHDQSIHQSGSHGWVFFSLPMIDQQAIDNSMTSIGQWPTAATGDFDGELSPIVRLLLAADAESVPALNRLGPDFQFSDVDPDNEAEVRDATAVLWGIKFLLLELASTGKETIRSRLETVLESQISDEQLNQLTYGLDVSVFRSIQQQWMPNLVDEILVHRPEFRKLKELSFIPDHSDNLGRWKLSPQDDGELLVENPLQHLLKNSSERPRGDPHPENSLPQVTERHPVQDTNAARPPLNRIHNAHAAPVPDAELLAHNPLSELESGQIHPSQQPPALPTPGHENSIQVSPGSAGGPALPGQNPPSSRQEHLRRFAEALSRISQIESDGWFRNDATFSVSYRNTGHGDRFMKSWSEIAVVANHRGLESGQDLYRKLSSPTFQGQCASCHAIDAGISSRSGSIVDWHPVYRDAGISSLTRFSHAPHLTQPELRDCSHCHELNSSTSSLATAAEFSDFVTMSKSSCVGCHHPGGAESNCTTCHSYHVGSHAKQVRLGTGQ